MQDAAFDEINDPAKYEDLVQRGLRRLSLKAFRAAVIVHQFRHEPRFAPVFTLMTLLMEIDNNLSKWRFHHAAMVHRFLGLKSGTGGSSGVRCAPHERACRPAVCLTYEQLPSSDMLPSHCLWRPVRHIAVPAPCRLFTAPSRCHALLERRIGVSIVTTTYFRPAFHLVATVLVGRNLRSVQQPVCIMIR